MSEGRQFTVRPLTKQPRPDLKDAFRLLLSSSSLATLKLRPGDLCSLTLSDGSSRTAVAWNAAENIQNTVVQTSRVLQDCYAIKLGEKVSIYKVDDSLDDVEIVYLVDQSDPETLTKYGDLSVPDRRHWEWSLEYPLSRCGLLSVGLPFELELKGQRRLFRVERIRSRSEPSAHTLLRFSQDSRVVIGSPETIVSRLQVQLSGLGGMSLQAKTINESLVDFSENASMLKMPSFYHHAQGILIYGPKGTGKTSLLRQIEAAGWRKSCNIGIIGGSPNEGETKIRNAFREALHNQPSVIVLDQLETVAPKKASLDSLSLAPVLSEGFDSVKDALVLVVAATRHPNDVDDSLRTPHRFAIEVELPIPTAQERGEIIREICGAASGQVGDALVQMLADKTHGYVGADLFALLQTACRKARKRQMAESKSTDVLRNTAALAPDMTTEPTVSVEIKEGDLLSALQESRPTAMREVFLETPKVRWTDIGGHHDVKKRLQMAVERPLKVGISQRMRIAQGLIIIFS